MPVLLIDATASLANPKGVGRYAYHLCLQMAQRLPKDWMIHVLVNRGNESLFPYDFRAKLAVVRQRSEIASAFLVIPREVRRLGCEILLKTYEGAGLVPGIRTVTVCHDIDAFIARAQGSTNPLRSAINACKFRLRRRALQRSDFVVCNSQFTRAAVQEQYGIAAGRTAVAYCAVDPRFYDHSRGVDAAALRKKLGVARFVLTFATGDPRENFRILPEVASQLLEVRLDTCLLVAGLRPRAAYVTQLRNEFRKRGMSEGIHFIFEDFLGSDRFQELVDLYSAADFYLELSLHEGFGMQLIEAMACGTTCISSPRGALTEVGSRYAIFADPTNPREIALVLRDAYQGGEHLRDNREQVQYTRQYSWDRAGSVVAGVLMQVAAREPQAEAQPA
ncbi:MAG TPA: glycosyltransferase [Terriglobales bacterium]|jgi:glycosyltransferase involved in cell wall biosynthesis